MGMSVDFLSLIERGMNAPSFKKNDEIAIALRLPLPDVFLFPEEVSPVS